MTRMIGVAIEIPQPWAQELSEWRNRVGDPHAASVPPHITLLPPTSLPADAIDAAEVHLDAVAAAHAPFELHLVGTDTFRPVSPVVFVAVDGGSGQCRRLQHDVRAGLVDAPAEFPYHPHVTVAHGVPEESLDRAAAGLARFEARFAVSAFTLYTHGYDRVWRRWRSFAFGGRVPAVRA